MPENVADRPDDINDRPAEVTDPLLWRLALGVADAHAPTEEGGCTHLICAGQDWPCEPWQQAQRALTLAQGGPADEPSAPTAPQWADWSGPAAGWTPQRSRRGSAAA